MTAASPHRTRPVVPVAPWVGFDVPPPPPPPLAPPAAPTLPRPSRPHGRAAAVGAVFLLWVAAMLLTAALHWPVLVPMIGGGVLIFVWGAVGDLYHHHRGRS